MLCTRRFERTFAFESATMNGISMPSEIRLPRFVTSSPTVSVCAPGSSGSSGTNVAVRPSRDSATVP